MLHVNGGDLFGVNPSDCPFQIELTRTIGGSPGLGTTKGFVQEGSLGKENDLLKL